MPQLETVLAFALVGVYLFDSVHFLSIGDAVLVTRRERLRQVTFGWSFELGGRRPYLPNPLTPFWPELRFQWTSGSLSNTKPDVATSEMLAFVTATKPISRLAALAGLFIVLVAPVVLTLGSEVLFLASAGVSFLLALAACCMLSVRRKAVGLNWSQVISMSLVALLCLPCAANLGRAVSKHHSWTLAASDIPALGFNVSEGDQIKCQVSAFLSRVRRLFPEDTLEYCALTSQINLLEGHGVERR
jgi:hypothetical protein